MPLSGTVVGRDGLVEAQWRSGRTKTASVIVRRRPALGPDRRASSRSASCLLLVAYRRACGSSAGRSRRISSKANSSGAACRRAIISTASGFAPRKCSNLVIGDPKHPDLTARHAIIQMRLKWNGSFEVYRDLCSRRAAARPAGARQGQLGPDRQAAAAAEQQAVPAAQFRAGCARQQRSALATPFGPVGVALEGNGKLSGGFKGHAAVVSPRLVPGTLRRHQLARQCRGRGRSRGVRRSRARSRSTASTAPPAGSTVVAPRFDAKASFNESFTSVDGSGRMAISTLIAGANGLAAFAGELTYKGPLTDVRGG